MTAEVEVSLIIRAGRPIVEPLERRCLASIGGALDTTFGAGGIASVPNRMIGTLVGPPLAAAHPLALQPDGKIIVAEIDHNTLAWVIARFNRDGTLDQSFANEGIFDAPFSQAAADNQFGPSPEPNAILVTTNGNIFIGGQSYYESSASLGPRLDAVLLELSTSGRQLMIRHDEFANVDLNGINSLAVQSDGRIIAGGYSGSSDEMRERFLLARYLPDGSLDPTFGHEGVVLSDIDGLADTVLKVAVAANGRIIAAGNSETITSNGFFNFEQAGDAVVARYTASGVVDRSFGIGGIARLDFPGAKISGCSDMAVASDGKLVISGDAEYQTPDGSVFSYLAAARLATAGTLDPSFNHNGLLVDKDIELGATGLAVQTDGKLFLAGILSQLDGNRIVERFRADGSVDSSFLTKVAPRTLTDSNTVLATVLQPDGKVLVFGEETVPMSPNVMYLARYLGDTGSIRGLIFNDLDGNAKHTANEPGTSGRTVYIDSNDNGQLDAGEPMTVSDQFGNYSFIGLDPATNVIVRQVLPTGWRQTMPGKNLGQHVNVVAGVVANAISFGSTDNVLIAGHVVSSTGTPLPGIRVWIDDDGDGIFQSDEQSLFTNRFGYFVFPNLKSGTHVIADSLGHSVSVTLARGKVATNLVLGG